MRKLFTWFFHILRFFSFSIVFFAEPKFPSIKRKAPSQEKNEDEEDGIFFGNHFRTVFHICSSNRRVPVVSGRYDLKGQRSSKLWGQWKVRHQRSDFFAFFAPKKIHRFSNHPNEYSEILFLQIHFYKNFIVVNIFWKIAKNFDKLFL